jgi:hypothetical protein
MFPTGYFPDSYFAPRYWPKAGEDPEPPGDNAGVRSRTGIGVGVGIGLSLLLFLRGLP